MSAIFLKAAETPLPSYIKRVNTLSTADEMEIKVPGVFNVEDAKLADSIKDIVRYFVKFYEIEGFSYTFESVLTIQEAIPILGS